MNYIIEKFDHIITSLSSSDKLSVSINKEEANDLINICKEEKEKIRLQMMEEVFNAREERTLELLIDKYQAVFIRLIDQLYAYQQANKKQQEYKLLVKALYEYLNELLYFLQIHYAKYFNPFQKMPFIKMEHIRKELKPKLDTIIAAFQRTILNEKLIRLIVQPLKQFIVSTAITYKESQYMMAIAGELLALDTTVPEEQIIVMVKRILISINFNSPELAAYLINELDNLISEEESVQGKLRILKYQLKEINQITIKPEYTLHNEYDSLKEQLINWLNEELSFYQTEQAVVVALPTTNISDTKIHTSLSVPQLALFFRLLKEEQLITNSNQSEFLKVVSGSFTTLHKESFSYGHLHGKYYKIEQHTKRTVYDILMRLLHLSRKIG